VCQVLRCARALESREVKCHASTRSTGQAKRADNSVGVEEKLGTMADGDVPAGSSNSKAKWNADHVEV